MARVPARLASFPGNVLEIIRAQCEGDWSRVTTDGKSIVVHNQSQEKVRTARKATERIMKSVPAPREVPKGRTEPPPAAVIIKRYDDEPPTVKVAPVVSFKAEPEINIDSVEVRVAEGDQDSDDFAGDVDLKAEDLAARFRETGLGERLPIVFYSEVLATAGLDLEDAERIVRFTKNVSMRPESVLKGYPVLAFDSGDVRVIVGFRDMFRPSIIRINNEMRLIHDEHHVTRTGGGGKKKDTQNGLPSTPEKIALGLRNLGADVPEFDLFKDEAVVVAYRGKNIGKLHSRSVTRQEGIATWSRLYRALNGVRAKAKE